MTGLLVFKVFFSRKRFYNINAFRCTGKPISNQLTTAVRLTWQPTNLQEYNLAFTTALTVRLTWQPTNTMRHICKVYT